MFRFIHAADIHLDSPLKGLESSEDAPVDEIRGATRRAFENLIDMAIEEEVNFVLIAGDLYDGDWKDYNTGIFFVRQISRLDKAGIKVFIISGNHDAANQITKTMPLPGNVTLFSHRKPQSVRLDDIGVIIHGQSYASRAVTDNLALQYPLYDSNYFNIGLVHTSLTGREGHENYAPCTLDELKSKGYDYWALGHIHKREIVSKNPWIIFPGNIQGRHVKESGAKGVSLVTVEDNRITAVEERAIDVLRWVICHVDLSECETIESVYDTVRINFERELGLADGKILALRLILLGRCAIHAQLFDRMDQWAEEIRGIAAGLGDIWLEKVEFRTSRKVSFKEITGHNTPLASLLLAIDRIKLDGDKLLEIVPDLALLKSKLPPDIHSLDKPFLDNSFDQIAELRTQVQELLIARLLKHEETR